MRPETRHQLLTRHLFHSDFNTGFNMLTGFCGKRAFFLGPMRSFSCGNLVIQTKHSSATMTTPEWQSTVRGNWVYDHLDGPTHRLDVSLRTVGSMMLAPGQTHGAPTHFVGVPSHALPQPASRRNDHVHTSQGSSGRASRRKGRTMASLSSQRPMRGSRVHARPWIQASATSTRPRGASGPAPWPRGPSRAPPRCTRCPLGTPSSLTSPAFTASVPQPLRRVGCFCLPARHQLCGRGIERDRHCDRP